MLKFMYSEKATKFCKISTVDLTDVTQDKYLVEMLQKIVAFSEYMNFILDFPISNNVAYWKDVST